MQRLLVYASVWSTAKQTLAPRIWKISWLARLISENFLPAPELTFVIPARKYNLRYRSSRISYSYFRVLGPHRSSDHPSKFSSFPPTSIKINCKNTNDSSNWSLCLPLSFPALISPCASATTSQSDRPENRHNLCMDIPKHWRVLDIYGQREIMRIYDRFEMEHTRRLAECRVVTKTAPMAWTNRQHLWSLSLISRLFNDHQLIISGKTIHKLATFWVTPVVGVGCLALMSNLPLLVGHQLLQIFNNGIDAVCDCLSRCSGFYGL